MPCFRSSKAAGQALHQIQPPLPGNVPINEHIERSLEQKVSFHACYFDIDHFKPFNDVLGCRRGDIIVLLAQTLGEIINPLMGFCGPIGGDDFMAVSER